MAESVDQLKYRSGVEMEKSSIKEEKKLGSEEGVELADEVDDHDVYVASSSGDK